MPTMSSSRRRPAVLATAGLALTAAPAAQAASSATGCPTTGLRSTTTLTNGVTTIGTSATISGSTATACGVLTPAGVGTLTATIRAKDIQFAPVVTKGGLLSIPTTVTATSPLRGPVAFTSTGQSASLGGSVLATADVLGQKCAIPLTVCLTTGRSGALTGKEFRYGPTGLTGKLVANTFAVPAIAPSTTCSLVAATLDSALLGLPLGPGASSITYDAAFQLR